MSYGTEFSTALAKMQGEFQTIPHNRTVEAGKYSYRYSTLDFTMDIVRPLLASHGFSLTNTMQVADGKLSMVTRLLHTTGESLESTLPIKVTGNPQDLGSELSYMKRYGAACLLGLAFEEEDDDGQKASQSPSTPPPAAPQKRKPPEQDGGREAALARGLWAEVNKTAEAMGLTQKEGVDMFRELIVESLGLDSAGEAKSTKALKPDEREHLLVELKKKRDACAPMEDD